MVQLCTLSDFAVNNDGVINQRDIVDILRTIPDPEMPISIVDLGLVQRVSVSQNGCEDASANAVRVEIDVLPTFVGCPALDMIEGDIRAKLSGLPDIREIKINWLFDPPWSVDRITVGGRESLKAHGVTVPERGSRLDVAGHAKPQAVALRVSAIACPFCGSNSTYLDSPFGPTRCRTIYYCEKCRNSFEHLKRL